MQVECGSHYHDLLDSTQNSTEYRGCHKILFVSEDTSLPTPCSFMDGQCWGGGVVGGVGCGWGRKGQEEVILENIAEFFSLSHFF